MTERWRTIRDFPDYSVSDHGRVRRDTPGRGARPGHIHKPGRWQSGKGHFFVMLRRDGESIHCAVHRLVALAFIGDPPFPGAKALHEDDNPAHNHFRNIRWGTSSDNAADRKRNRGWHDLRGEANPAAKLTIDQVAEIKRGLDLGVCGSCLGKLHGVTKETVYAIKAERTWSHAA